MPSLFVFSQYYFSLNTQIEWMNHLVRVILFDYLFVIYIFKISLVVYVVIPFEVEMGS